MYGHSQLSIHGFLKGGFSKGQLDYVFFLKAGILLLIQEASSVKYPPLLPIPGPWEGLDWRIKMPN